jgi:hypothetical protein
MSIAIAFGPKRHRGHEDDEEEEEEEEQEDDDEVVVIDDDEDDDDDDDDDGSGRGGGCAHGAWLDDGPYVPGPRPPPLLPLGQDLDEGSLFEPYEPVPLNDAQVALFDGVDYSAADLFDFDTTRGEQNVKNSLLLRTLFPNVVNAHRPVRFTSTNADAFSNFRKFASSYLRRADPNATLLSRYLNPDNGFVTQQQIDDARHEFGSTPLKDLIESLEADAQSML